MTLAEDLEHAWITVARRPEGLRGIAQVDPLPPRLWERLRVDLQVEYRRATGEEHATLAVLDNTAIERTAATIAAARELLAAIDFDNNGRMIGMERLGGNGGMISLATSKAADKLRLLLSEGGR